MAWAVIVKLPVAALGLAPKTTIVFAPATTLKGLDGVETTSLGRLLRVIWTAAVNPFWALTSTLTGELVPPCGTETAFVERVSEKSWEGEVWVIWDWPLAPPPQPERRKIRMNTESTKDTLRRSG